MGCIPLAVSCSHIGYNKQTFVFIAHGVQEYVLECVSGLQNELNTDGSPKYQQVDCSKLTPILWQAMQELVAEMEVLKRHAK